MRRTTALVTDKNQSFDPKCYPCLKTFHKAGGCDDGINEELERKISSECQIILQNECHGEKAIKAWCSTQDEDVKSPPTKLALSHEHAKELKEEAIRVGADKRKEQYKLRHPHTEII